jgi:putative transposase
MARSARKAPGGLVYHVLNRTVGRMKMFRSSRDFEAFQRVLDEAHARHPVPILSYCLMATHWHFVVLPKDDGDVSAFFRWLALTHAMRWRVSHRTVGYGHLYQGRFKSFPVQTDGHLLSVCRYVERNALSAGLVERAEAWRWSSLWVRLNGSDDQKAMLSTWPTPRPDNWLEWVNTPITAREQERLSTSMTRGRPFGDDKWTAKAIRTLGLEHTVRKEGRPPNPKKADEKTNATAEVKEEAKRGRN